MAQKRPSRLAKFCRWNKAKVPAAWLELPPGTMYRANTPMKGKRVKLRGAEWEVKGVGTPAAPSSKKLRRSRRYVCQGTYILGDPHTPHGPVHAVPRSIVGAAIRRPPNKTRMCRKQARTFLTATPADLRAIEREAERTGEHPWDFVGDYEFPHMEGSGPCCPNADTGVRESFDPDAAWEALRQRVNSRKAKAGMSTAREVARRRQKFLRAGGDAADPNYTESLVGGGKGRRR